MKVSIPVLKKGLAFSKSRSQYRKRDYDSESLDPVSIAKTQSRSSLMHIFGRSLGEAAKLSKQDNEVWDHHTTKDEDEKGGLYLRYMGGPVL